MKKLRYHYFFLYIHKIATNVSTMLRLKIYKGGWNYGDAKAIKSDLNFLLSSSFFSRVHYVEIYISNFIIITNHSKYPKYYFIFIFKKETSFKCLIHFGICNFVATVVIDNIIWYPINLFLATQVVDCLDRTLLYSILIVLKLLIGNCC